MNNAILNMHSGAIMETEYLKQLILFQTNGSLSKTAESLHTSQPSITRNMQKLEDYFGVNLFERKKNSIALNENGKLACKYAQALLNQEEDMRKKLKEYASNKNEIDIGSCAPLPLTMLLTSLTFHLSNISTKGELQSEEEMIQGLRENKYQIIILNHIYDHKDFISIPICSEKLFISVHKDHSLYKKRAVTFQEINGTSFLLSMQIGIWKDLVFQKMPNTHFLETADSDILSEIAANSDICTFATDLGTRLTGARKNRKMIPISDADATMDFYAILSKNDSELIKAIQANIY